MSNDTPTPPPDLPPPPTPAPDKVYLGDGAYAEFGPFGTKLTAENGMEATDTVYMEDQVLEAFLRALTTRYKVERMIEIMEGKR